MNRSIPILDWNPGHFGVGFGGGHINAEKAVHIAGFGAGQIVSGRQFDNTFKWTVRDFHDEEAALGGAASVGTVSGNAEAITLDCDFEAVAFHACQFDLDDETFVGRVNVGIRDPVTTATTHGGASRDKMHRRADFSNGHVLNYSSNIRTGKRNKRLSLCWNITAKRKRANGI